MIMEKNRIPTIGASADPLWGTLEVIAKLINNPVTSGENNLSAAKRMNDTPPATRLEPGPAREMKT